MGGRAEGFGAMMEMLVKGDPLTWAFVGGFVVVGLAIGLFAVKIHFDHKREDAAAAKRSGRSKWPR